MSSELDPSRPLSLEGRVVEIFERSGLRLARVRLDPFTVLDVATGSLGDLHLGDHVVITGSLAVERIRQDPDEDARTR